MKEDQLTNKGAVALTGMTSYILYWSIYLPVICGTSAPTTITHPHPPLLHQKGPGLSNDGRLTYRVVQHYQRSRLIERKVCAATDAGCMVVS